MHLDMDSQDTPPRQPTPPLGRGHRIKRPSLTIRESMPEGPRLTSAAARRLEKLQKANEATNNVPEAMPDAPETQVNDPNMDEPPLGSSGSVITTVFKTIANAFGTWREYLSEPVTMPDLNTSNAPRPTQQSTSGEPSEEAIKEIISPYPNLSCFKVAHIANALQSVTDNMANILRAVILDPTIIKEDIVDAPLDKLRRKTAESRNFWEDGKRGWRKGSLTIEIPSGKKRDQNTANSSRVPDDSHYEVENFWYRPIVPLMRTILSTYTDAKTFHYEPYRQWWSRPGTSDPPSRVYDELYTSDSWLEEHEKVQKIVLPPDEPDIYPRAVAGLLFWSDSTHLADFGQATLWPIYMAFGNQSKYERAKPGNRAMHHLAYLPSVSTLRAIRLHMPEDTEIACGLANEKNRGSYCQANWC